MPAPPTSALIEEYDAGLLTYAGGASIDRWPGILHGYDLLQGAGGLRPTMQTAVFLGGPAVRFDAVDDVLLSAAIGENMPLIHSMYVTYQHVTAPPALFKNSLFVFAAGNNWHTVAQSAGGQHIAEITRNAGAQQFQRARSRVARTLSPLVWGQDYDGSGAATGLHALYGGLTDIETTIAAIGVPAGALTTPQVQTPANVPFNIDVRHIALFNRRLTPLESHLFHAYLSSRIPGLPNVSSDLRPTATGTVFGVASPGGPGASITVPRPGGAGASVVAVFMLNLSRNSGDPIYTITPPAGVVTLRETVNDQAFFGIYAKTIGAFPGAEPANYTFGIAPATNNGGDIHCDTIDGVRLTPPGPIYSALTFAKGSGFSGGPPVVTTDWSIILPGAPMLTRWIIKVGSDGRVSVPDWTVPAHYLEDTAIAAQSSFQRRSGGVGTRTDTITASVGAMGVVGAVSLVSASAIFGHSLLPMTRVR